MDVDVPPGSRAALGALPPGNMMVPTGERGTAVDIRPADSAPTLAKGLLPAAPPAATQTGEIMVPPGPSTSDSMATKDQLVQAQEYLGTLRSDRAESCRELEEEAKVFLDSPSTPEQERRFRLIYQLLRYQEKLAAMARVQAMVGGGEDDPDVKALTIALVNGRIVDATIRVVERALEAMRELNGTSAVVKEPCPPSAWEQSKKEQEPAPPCGPTDPSGQKPAKRSRLPAAAVKEMRTWLDQHWDDPVPTHEEKAGFAQRHDITTKQVENWFINIRMREWRPAMRRALDHAEETGSYAEFSRLLQHTADGNVFKKFLEEREMGHGSALVPPPSLQRFIGAEGFAAFVGERSNKRMR